METMETVPVEENECRIRNFQMRTETGVERLTLTDQTVIKI
jgi:hypothetical protein